MCDSVTQNNKTTRLWDLYLSGQLAERTMSTGDNRIGRPNGSKLHSLSPNIQLQIITHED